MLKPTNVFICIIILCLAQAGGPAFAQLTPEEATRPAEEWTKQQILEKGWIPYGDDGILITDPGVAKVAVGRWPRNDSTPLGTCVTYSFGDVAYAIGAHEDCPDDTNSFPGAMPDGSAAEITKAAVTWAAAADIHFFLGPDNGRAFDAAGARLDIRIAAHEFDGPLGSEPGATTVFAHGYFPPPNGVTAAGDLHFDDEDSWIINGGTTWPPWDVQTVALHELGHALGLNSEHVGALPGDVMFPAYEGVKRALSANDITQITAIYGAAVPGHSNACVLAVTVVSFTGKAIVGSVTQSWATESEIDHEGFNVLRSTSPDGAFEQVNEVLIPAVGGPAFGAAYAFIDDTAAAHTSYYYLLEDIHTSGIRTLHGAGACTLNVDPECEPLAVTVP